MLSEQILIGISIFTSSSSNSPFSQVNSSIVAATLLYSASAELLDTICCFFDFQVIRDSPNLTAYPVTELLVFGKAAQSESH